MNKIIPFPTNRIQHTNGFLNLKALFEVCDTVESCNFYLESVEILAESDKITESEMYTLRRIGRQKRIELANPQTQVREATTGTNLYTPEMNQSEPIGCDMKAGLCFYGGHYWIKTKLELKGRGITRNEPSRDGYNNYTVTKLAYKKLEQQYKIAYESSLD